jgi:hypothetical protein
VTDVPADVLAALRRAEDCRLRGAHKEHLGALLVLAALAAAGRAVPSAASVRTGSLVRDRRGVRRRVLKVSAGSVAATSPPPARNVRIPWHKITGFCDPPPPPGTVTRRRTPSLF